MKRTTLLLASAILLSACEAGRVISDACDPWRPIRVSRDDVLTIETARQALAHNLTGARLCGWEEAR